MVRAEASSLSVPLFRGVGFLGLAQLVAATGAKVKSIELLELANSLQSVGRKGAFAFKRVQNDAFEQIAEVHVSVLGQGLQDLQQPLLDSYPRLHSLHNVTLGSHLRAGCAASVESSTYVSWYQGTLARNVCQRVLKGGVTSPSGSGPRCEARPFRTAH